MLWVLTTGLQFVIGWYYRRSAVFYLPPGWLGPLAWWLSLPFAPRGLCGFVHPVPRLLTSWVFFAGSVSVGIWQMACKRVIKLGERVVRDIVMTSAFFFKKKKGDVSDCARLKMATKLHRRKRIRDHFFPVLNL